LNRQSVYGDAQPFQAYSSALHHRARAEQAKLQCGCLEPLEVLTVRPVGLLDQRQLQSATPRVANVQQTCSRHEPRHRAICRLNGLKATDNMRYQSDESVAVANQTRGVDDNIVTAQKRRELICRQGGNIGFMHFNLVPP
jgi:hypothetical protein